MQMPTADTFKTAFSNAIPSFAFQTRLARLRPYINLFRRPT